MGPAYRIYARPTLPRKASQTAMFQEAGKETLELARQAARYLYEKRRALGLDEPTAARLDTLAADISMELEDRADPKTNAAASRADDR
jgi:hypothetical protein